jgi:hypothetical protein
MELKKCMSTSGHKLILPIDRFDKIYATREKSNTVRYKNENTNESTLILIRS